MLAEVLKPPEPGPPPKKPVLQLTIFLWGAAIVLSLFFALACWSYAKQVGDSEWIYVAVVFGLPLLQVFVILPVLRKSSEFGANGALVLVPAISLEILLWFAFTYREICKSVLGVASWIGLGSAIVLGLIVFVVTGLIMGVGDGLGKQLTELLKEQPFLVVCFFLTVFSFITLFLSLALALHDQDLRLNHRTYALHAEDLRPIQENDDVGPSEIEARTPPNEPYKVRFTRGSATVEVLEDISDDEFSQLEDPIQVRNALNERQLRSLTAAIIEQAEKDQVRVVLGGYSDDLPVSSASGSYNSNFELSQARINQVMANLISRLETYPQREWRRNVEWLVLPSATGRGFLNGEGEDAQPKERLAVQIALLPSDGDRFSHGARAGGRDLTLLDYSYFGVYTITTTGYGDIKPVSVYSKFITIVANFFEVFLMVVFFNVLLSLLREEHRPGPSGSVAPAA